jgi:serine phosphatase RsbU (regulator of sigma subunit)
VTSEDTRGEHGNRLDEVQSITDATLSRLDAGDMLVELLDRVREVLRADTAAVLLLDRSSGQLVATAARGLEEEVRQGVRIPVGRGFAGRIASEQRPVIIDHVDSTNVLNPILIAAGITSLMGAPLLVNGSVIGVVHVGSLAGRTFTSRDAELLQLAADRAALAVQSLMLRSDHMAAAALTRSLVPAVLPAVPGLQLAARYVPGAGSVGGDWYDVFRLPSGEVGAVVGDVAGSGLGAAVIMGRMRSALRAYALETSDPADVLGRLDRKMQHFEPGAMATVLYAVFDSDLRHVRISSAGHVPPVIATPGRPAVLAEVTPGLMIGVADAGRRPVAALPAPPGTVLCCYTDGLVERRGRPLDDGLARLCEVLVHGDADTVSSAVMAGMSDGEQADDVALLVLRRTGEAVTS